MRHIDVQDELAEGFEVSPVPVGRDGAPEIAPMRRVPEQPPRLCEAGPCQNYHRVQLRMDAADPLPEKGEDGTVTEHPASYHVETHHYCYPSPGIEMKLGGLPVLQCNRWEPITDRTRTATVERIFYESEAGQKFKADQLAWQAARDAELAAAAQGEAEAAAELALMNSAPTIAPSGPELIVRGHVPHRRVPLGTFVRVKWTQTVWDAVSAALKWHSIDDKQPEGYIVTRWKPARDGAKRTSLELRLDDTIAATGLLEGDEIILTLKPTEGAP